MDSQTQALFESPTISKYGLSEINIPTAEDKLKLLKRQKIEEDAEKSQSSTPNTLTPTNTTSIAPFFHPGIPSTSTGIRRQRFVIHPTMEPGPSNFGTKNVREASPKPYYFGEFPASPSTPPKPKHHASMRSVVSGPQLQSLHFPEPHQRTIGGASSPITPLSPQLLHLARSGSYIFNETGSTRLFTDSQSVRSLASFGLGSTDGKRLYIRKVPNSPAELMHILNPPT